MSMRLAAPYPAFGLGRFGGKKRQAAEPASTAPQILFPGKPHTPPRTFVESTRLALQYVLTTLPEPLREWVGQKSLRVLVVKNTRFLEENPDMFSSPEIEANWVHQTWKSLKAHPKLTLNVLKEQVGELLPWLQVLKNPKHLTREQLAVIFPVHTLQTFRNLEGPAHVGGSSTILMPYRVAAEGWNQVRKTTYLLVRTLRHELGHLVDEQFMPGKHKRLSARAEFRRLLLADLETARRNGRLPDPKDSVSDLNIATGYYLPIESQNDARFEESFAEISASLMEGGAFDPGYLQALCPRATAWVKKTLGIKTDNPQDQPQ